MRARPKIHKATDPQIPSTSGRAIIGIGIEGKAKCKNRTLPKTAKPTTHDPHEIHKDQKRAKWLVEPVCRVSETQDPQDPQDPHGHVVLHMHVDF